MSGVDWRTLPAGLALDRVVAEALGWRVQPFEYPRMYGVVFAPGGSESIIKLGLEYGDYAIVQGNGWPVYSTDANAALTLFSNVGVDGLEFFGTFWRAFYNPSAAEFRGFDDGNTPALAICRAYLSHRDKQS